MIEFFNACNSYGRSRSVDVSFFEDEYEGWFARFSFSDMRGPFSALVPFAAQSKGESDDDYGTRMSKEICALCAQARSKRRLAA